MHLNEALFFLGEAILFTSLDFCTTSRAAKVQGARCTGIGMYARIHEDFEHRATIKFDRTVVVQRSYNYCAHKKGSSSFSPILFRKRRDEACPTNAP